MISSWLGNKGVLLPPLLSADNAGCTSSPLPLVTNDTDQVAPPLVEVASRMWLLPEAPSFHAT